MCLICRSWDKVYVVLNGNLLSCYKDKKIAKQVRSLRMWYMNKTSEKKSLKNLSKDKININGEVQQQ